jgi:hypothetical protein
MAELVANRVHLVLECYGIVPVSVEIFHASWPSPWSTHDGAPLFTLNKAFITIFYKGNMEAIVQRLKVSLGLNRI